MADKRITSRTKVYITRIGLKDWLVAANSQKAALAAWDVHRNLFAEGAARITNDPGHVELAMKTPGAPVAAGGPSFAQVVRNNVVDLASRRKPKAAADDERPTGPPSRRREAKAPAPPPPPKRDRSKLDAAEDELRAFEKDAVRGRAEIERRKRAIETELEAFDREAERRRERLTKRVAREKDAYDG